MELGIAIGESIMLEVDVLTADGRTLHAYNLGPTGSSDELVLMWHSGTPNTGAPPEPLFDVANSLGIRWIGYDRPGYEASYIEPELTALPNGSIKLSIPGIPMNGARTDQTLTIAWRNDAFIVAGFAYDYHDYMKDNVASDCDYNLLTGKGKSSKMQPDGTRLHRTVAVEGKVVPFATWDSGASVTDCGE